MSGLAGKKKQQEQKLTGIAAEELKALGAKIKVLEAKVIEHGLLGEQDPESKDPPLKVQAFIATTKILYRTIDLYGKHITSATINVAAAGVSALWGGGFLGEVTALKQALVSDAEIEKELNQLVKALCLQGEFPRELGNLNMSLEAAQRNKLQAVYQSLLDFSSSVTTDEKKPAIQFPKKSEAVKALMEGSPTSQVLTQALVPKLDLQPWKEAWPLTMQSSPKQREAVEKAFSEAKEGSESEADLGREVLPYRHEAEQIKALLDAFFAPLQATWGLLAMQSIGGKPFLPKEAIEVIEAVLGVYKKIEDELLSHDFLLNRLPKDDSEHFRQVLPAFRQGVEQKIAAWKQAYAERNQAITQAAAASKQKIPRLEQAITEAKEFKLPEDGLLAEIAAIDDRLRHLNTCYRQLLEMDRAEGELLTQPLPAIAIPWLSLIPEGQLWAVPWDVRQLKIRVATDCKHEFTAHYSECLGGIKTASEMWAEYSEALSSAITQQETLLESKKQQLSAEETKADALIQNHTRKIQVELEKRKLPDLKADDADDEKLLAQLTERIALEEQTLAWLAGLGQSTSAALEEKLASFAGVLTPEDKAQRIESAIASLNLGVHQAEHQRSLAALKQHQNHVEMRLILKKGNISKMAELYLSKENEIKELATQEETLLSDIKQFSQEVQELQTGQAARVSEKEQTDALIELRSRQTELAETWEELSLSKQQEEEVKQQIASMTQFLPTLAASVANYQEQLIPTRVMSRVSNLLTKEAEIKKLHADAVQTQASKTQELEAMYAVQKGWATKIQKLSSTLSQRQAEPAEIEKELNRLKAESVDISRPMSELTSARDCLAAEIIRDTALLEEKTGEQKELSERLSAVTTKKSTLAEQNEKTLTEMRTRVEQQIPLQKSPLDASLELQKKWEQDFKKTEEIFSQLQNLVQSKVVEEKALTPSALSQDPFESKQVEEKTATVVKTTEEKLLCAQALMDAAVVIHQTAIIPVPLFAPDESWAQGFASLQTSLKTLAESKTAHPFVESLRQQIGGISQQSKLIETQAHEMQTAAIRSSKDSTQAALASLRSELSAHKQQLEAARAAQQAREGEIKTVIDHMDDARARGAEAYLEAAARAKQKLSFFRKNPLAITTVLDEKRIESLNAKLALAKSLQPGLVEGLEKEITAISALETEVQRSKATLQENIIKAQPIAEEAYDLALRVTALDHFQKSLEAWLNDYEKLHSPWYEYLLQFFYVLLEWFSFGLSGLQTEAEKNHSAIVNVNKVLSDYLICMQGLQKGTSLVQEPRSSYGVLLSVIESAQQSLPQAPAQAQVYTQGAQASKDMFPLSIPANTLYLAPCLDVVREEVSAKFSPELIHSPRPRG